jgi:hypothetical protein
MVIIMSLTLDSAVFTLPNTYQYAVAPGGTEVFCRSTNPKRKKESIDGLVSLIKKTAETTKSEFEKSSETEKNTTRASKVIQAIKYTTMLKAKLIKVRDNIGGTSIFSPLIRYFKSDTISNYNKLIHDLEIAERDFTDQRHILHDEFRPNALNPLYKAPAITPLLDGMQIQTDILAKIVLEKFGFTDNKDLIAVIKASNLSIRNLYEPTESDKDKVANILFDYLKTKHPSKATLIKSEIASFFAQDPSLRILNKEVFDQIERRLNSRSPVAPSLPPILVPSSPVSVASTLSDVSSVSIQSASPSPAFTPPSTMQKFKSAFESTAKKVENTATETWTYLQKKFRPDSKKPARPTPSPIAEDDIPRMSLEDFLVRG